MSHHIASHLFTVSNIQQDSWRFLPDGDVIFTTAKSIRKLNLRDTVAVRHHKGCVPSPDDAPLRYYTVISINELKHSMIQLRITPLAILEPRFGEPWPNPSPLANEALNLTLLDRVADAIAAVDDKGYTNMTWICHARAAIRVVAEWVRENPGPNSAWPAVARDLMDEANR